MIWKRMICAAAVISMLFSATQVAYASYSYISKDTTNIVTVSNVGIKLEYSDETADTLALGIVKHKTVAIKNTGKKPVYVRLRFEKYWSEKDTSAEAGARVDAAICSPDYIKFKAEKNGDWSYNQSDGYFYYKTLLQAKDTTTELAYSYEITEDVIEKVLDTDGSVKETKYRKEYQDRQGNVTAYGEAVQEISDQFVHDYIMFDAEDAGKVVGWNNVQFNSTALPESSETPGVDASAQPNVEFADDASQFVTLHGDNLFLNMSGVLPGDTRTQNITIANRSEEQVEIYLYAKPAENDYSSAEAKEAMDLLLQNITLKVDKVLGDGTADEIYNGDLGRMSSEKGEENKILLGVFRKGDVVELQAGITLNPDWNIGNAETKIHWVFLCVKEVADTPVPTEPKIVRPGSKRTPIPVTEAPTPEITEPPTAAPTQVPTAVPTQPVPQRTNGAAKPPPQFKETTAPKRTPVVTEKPEAKPTPVKTKKPVVKPFFGDKEPEDAVITPEPIQIEDMPTTIPIEEQDDPIDPNAAVRGNRPSGKPGNGSGDGSGDGIKKHTDPKTGDANRIVLWSAAFVLSLVVFVVTLRDSRRSKQGQERGE